jgi:hypothetical protein
MFASLPRHGCYCVCPVFWPSVLDPGESVGDGATLRDLREIIVMVSIDCAALTDPPNLHCHKAIRWTHHGRSSQQERDPYGVTKETHTGVSIHIVLE